MGDAPPLGCDELLMQMGNTYPNKSKLNEKSKHGVFALFLFEMLYR